MKSKVKNTMKNASFDWHFSVSQKKNIKTYIILFVVLIVYLLEVILVGYSIPCPFHYVTGLKCPGCGITRMIISLAHLDFKRAFYYNPFLFVTGPLLLYFFFKNMLYSCGITKWNITKKDNIILYIYTAMLIIFGIVRNL